MLYAEVRIYRNGDEARRIYTTITPETAVYRYRFPKQILDVGLALVGYTLRFDLEVDESKPLTTGTE